MKITSDGSNSGESMLQEIISANLCEIFGEESQRITSEKLGVSSAIVGFWRNGRTRPSYEALLKIADVYDVTVDWILGRPGAVKTRESGIEEICSETGLSEKAVKNLKRNPFNVTLSRIMENPCLFDYLEAMEKLSVSICDLDMDLEKFSEEKRSGKDPLLCEMAVREDIDQIRMQRYEANDCAERMNEAVYNGARAIRKGKRFIAEQDPLQT